MRLWPPGAVLGCLLLACAAGEDAASKDKLKDTTATYAISGSSGPDLRAALDRLGPKNDEGGRSDAITRWNFAYTYSVKRSPGRCALESVETDTTITRILPRWTPPPGAPRDLVRKWDDYVTCAALHENGHRRIYLDAVAKFRERAGVIADSATCDDVVGALDALAREILKQLKDDQSAYETRTDHGYVQCGHFP